MSPFLNSPILVTGANGQLGRGVIDHLLAAGAGNVIAASRHPEKLADLAARGVVTRKVDFEDAASLAAAFAGVERALIVSTDAIDTPGKRLAQHRAAIGAALEAGVGHLAYTSMPNPGPTSLVPFAPDHLGSEQAIAQSGAGYTILRNNMYMDNAHGWLPGVLASGKWFTSAGTGRVGYVSRDDAARAAAAALTSETGSQTVDITGTRSLSVDEFAVILREVFDKPVEVIQVSDQQLTDGLTQAGLPPFLAALLAAFDASARAGQLDVTTDAVQHLTGRAPQSMHDFLVEHRSAFEHGH